MPNFLVRVELHGASSTDYTTLHSTMINAGFSRRIHGDDGRNYQLPTAEYLINTSQTIEQVRDRAYTAANIVRANPAVLAVKFDQAAWQGLDPA